MIERLIASIVSMAIGGFIATVYWHERSNKQAKKITDEDQQTFDFVEFSSRTNIGDVKFSISAEVHDMTLEQMVNRLGKSAYSPKDKRGYIVQSFVLKSDYEKMASREQIKGAYYGEK